MIDSIMIVHLYRFNFLEYIANIFGVLNKSIDLKNNG